MSWNRRDNISEYEACPDCGMPTFYHDKDARRHVCINEECGYIVDDNVESILTKLLRLLRLKKK